MFIQQLYTNCLAEAAYYIESEGEAAIIDPVRETEPYLTMAAERKTKIKYVFETHFHADFVSGHIDLAAKTGAKIIFGPNAETGYHSHSAQDGEVFTVGKIKIKVLHTPGHTVESSCYLLSDENGKDSCIFTGDTLFVGDVGRPDLLDSTVSLTKEDMAGMMYDSLNYKIKNLADEVIVYPAHGPGSACGKNIGKETWSTIGQQKKSNYALQDISREEFVKVLTSDLAAPPMYFFSDASINKKGYESLESVVKHNLKPLSAEEFEKEINQGALVLDTRSANDFEKCFVMGALNIGLDGTFAVWVGTVVDIKTPLILVTESGKEEETVVRLARVGYENIRGYLNGGIQTWVTANKPCDHVDSITPEEFAASCSSNTSSTILDVRKDGEVKAGKVQGAQTIPLDSLLKNIAQVDKNTEYLIHCAGGYRSMIASSLLKARGYSKLKNVYGGFNKIKNTGVPIV